MVHKKPFGHDQQEDSTSTPENVADDATLSGDEAYEVNAPSPKKRRAAQKKVVTVPIGEVDGSRSKGEVYPPPDSWSWRKYGQKPIKGSPYPRGYYRCSSSKGCLLENKLRGAASTPPCCSSPIRVSTTTLCPPPPNTTITTPPPPPPPLPLLPPLMQQPLPPPQPRLPLIIFR